MEGKVLKTRNCVAYGLGDLYGGGAFLLISTFTMYYLVAVVGMNPVLAGLIPGLGKIWDAVSDPLMGYISDRTRSKMGKRRVWFLVGIIPIFVSMVLIWLPVKFSTNFGLFLYYFLAYIFFYTVSTMVLVPYGALSAEMAEQFKDRNKLTGFRMFFSMLAALICGTVPEMIINRFQDPRTGHLVMGIVFGIFFMLPWIFVYFGTWDKQEEQIQQKKTNFIKNFASIFTNKTFRIHILMYIFAYATMDVLMGWIKFYLADYLHKPGFLIIGMGSILITQIAFIPLYISIANKRGHAIAYRVGLLIMAIGIAAMYLHGPATPIIILAINCIIIGAGQSAAVLVPFQLLPFVADIDELMTGEKRAGTYAGAMTLIRKLIQGSLVLPLLGLILSFIGYLGPLPKQFTVQDFENNIIPQVRTKAPEHETAVIATYVKKDSLYVIEQTTDSNLIRQARLAFDTINYKGTGASRATVATPQTLATQGSIRLLFSLIPVIFLTLGFLSSLRFRLNPETHKILREEIDRLNAGGSKEEVTPEVKTICQELSGKEYEKIRT